MRYRVVQLWELHEAFAVQVLANPKAIEDKDFVKTKVGIEDDLGEIPRDRLNPKGGSVAIGHPFGATGARILSQAVKELAAMPSGSQSHCQHLRGWRLGYSCIVGGGIVRTY